MAALVFFMLSFFYFFYLVIWLVALLFFQRSSSLAYVTVIGMRQTIYHWQVTVTAYNLIAGIWFEFVSVSKSVIASPSNTPFPPD